MYFCKNKTVKQKIDYEAINERLAKLACPICKLYPVEVSVGESKFMATLRCDHDEILKALTTENIKLKNENP